MTTLTYCKGWPTVESEMNALGFTELEMFLSAYAPVFHKAACETANHFLSDAEFNKSKWNTHLQSAYGISKRHANGVISFTKGAVDAAKEARKLHIKTLEGKIKSCEQWIKKAENKLKNALKFYSKKNWYQGTLGCAFPLSCSLKFRDTNWQNLHFQIHNKKRKFFIYQNKLPHIKNAPLRVVIPRNPSTARMVSGLWRFSSHHYL